MSWISKVRPWQLLVLAVLLSEALTTLLSLVFRGELAHDYLITGLAVSSLAASLTIYFMLLLNRFRFGEGPLKGEVIERQRAQQDLDRIFKLSGDLICTASMTHFLSVNPAGERMLGYSQEELRDIPFMDLIHPEDIGSTGKVLVEELKKGKSVIGFVNRYRGRDGAYRWLEWVTHPVPEEDRLYAVARDITGRKEREDQLLLLKKTVEMISTGITIAGLDGRIVYTNPSEARMHGYNADELVGENVSIFMPDGKEDAFQRERTVDEVRGWKEWAREIEEVRRDGSVFPVMLKSLPVELSDKRGAYIITTSEDITERKKDEEKLMLQAQMIDLLKDSLVTTGMDGVVTSWNRGAERLFGYTSFEATGRHISFVYPPEEHDNLQETINLLKEKGRHEAEVRMRRKSGEPFYAILSLSMIYDEKGDAAGMLGYSIDVTQRKRMEEELRNALEQKDLLMREVYHRTKNNMNIIQSLLRLQSGHVKDREVLNSLSETAYRVRAMSMIHERLYRAGDLSRINIREYLQSLATELFNGVGSEADRIALRIDVPEIMMDVDQVIPAGLIVNELLTNSLKYAFPDGRSGEVLVELKDRDRETFELAVSDNGIGLPGGLDIPSLRTFGLQLVSSLSAQIDGRLDVSGGNGATFRITFGKNPES
jgi:PAS domain S-box-containing protein